MDLNGPTRLDEEALKEGASWRSLTTGRDRAFFPSFAALRAERPVQSALPMASPYSGNAVIDDDVNHRWWVQIDDLDRRNWLGMLTARPLGGAILLDGHEVRVTLVNGPRAGEASQARFRSKEEFWLVGESAFAPPS